MVHGHWNGRNVSEMPYLLFSGFSYHFIRKAEQNPFFAKKVETLGEGRYLHFKA